MKQKPMRVGLMGFGYAGRTFHAPLIAAVDGLDLIAVASSDEAKVRSQLAEVAVHETAEAMLADDNIDLVVIATPNETHAPLARRALAAGKHVVIDKPFALDMDEARDLIRIADAAGRLLTVFHNRRWDSDYLSVKAAIEAGAVDRVVHFESRIERFRPVVRDRWRERPGRGSGVWFDLGPHLVDQALQLFGLPERVSADLAGLRDGAGTDDWANVRLIYPDRRVVIQIGLLGAGGAPRFVVHGTAGTLIKASADRQESQLLGGLIPGAPGWGEDPDELILYDGEGGRHASAAVIGDQRRFYAELAEAVRDRTSFSLRPHECLGVMAVIEAAFASMAQQRATSLPLSDQERAAW